MKSRAILLGIIGMVVLLSSCAHPTKITKDSSSPRITIHPISTLGVLDHMKSRNEQLKDFYLFTKEKDFSEFTKKYFGYPVKPLELKLNLKAYELLLINCRWQNKRSGMSYRLKDIFRQKNGIEVQLEKVGYIKMAAIKEGEAPYVNQFLYVQLSSGTIQKDDSIIVERMK